MLEVTDDSGFLAVVVPSAYRGDRGSRLAVGPTPGTFSTTDVATVIADLGHRFGGCWRVDVKFGELSINGFREQSGPLTVVGGAILITNFESLTMAAQYESVMLPESHQEIMLVNVPDGDYCCRVVQMFNPEQEESARRANADFVLHFSRPETMPAVWAEIPWFTHY